MRNKISCAADKLSQLDPCMIEAVVAPEAFSIGRQYAIEHRAQIIESDDTSLTSSVIGTHGLYAQSLRLKAGQLFTKCSCPLTEQPFCRHCVSSLLAFFYRTHHQEVVQPPAGAGNSNGGATRPIIVEATAESPGSPAPPPARSPREPNSGSGELGFREVAQFMEWMQPAVAAMENLDPLPPVPDHARNSVLQWIEAVRSLEERQRESEEQARAQFEAVQALQAQIGRLTEELEAANRVAKEAQAAGDDLRRELDQTRGAMQRLAAAEHEQQALQARLDSLLGEIRKKESDLTRLSAELKEFSEWLHTTAA
jgi:hypothetical protein